MTKTLVSNSLWDSPFLNFLFLDIQTRGMSQDLHWTKANKSNMVVPEKLPVKRTRSISVQNPSSFLTSPTTLSVRHVVVQSPVVEAPAPTLVTKSVSPPSRPIQRKSFSEKPTSIHDATHLSIPTRQETNSSEKESTVPTTIVTHLEIISSLPPHDWGYGMSFYFSLWLSLYHCIYSLTPFVCFFLLWW